MELEQQQDFVSLSLDDFIQDRKYKGFVQDDHPPELIEEHQPEDEQPAEEVKPSFFTISSGHIIVGDESAKSPFLTSRYPTHYFFPCENGSWSIKENYLSSDGKHCLFIISHSSLSSSSRPRKLGSLFCSSSPCLLRDYDSSYLIPDDTYSSSSCSLPLPSGIYKLQGKYSHRGSLVEISITI